MIFIPVSGRIVIEEFESEERLREAQAVLEESAQHHRSIIYLPRATVRELVRLISSLMGDPIYGHGHTGGVARSNQIRKDSAYMRELAEKRWAKYRAEKTKTGT